jgi:hypothetical protein
MVMGVCKCRQHDLSVAFNNVVVFRGFRSRGSNVGDHSSAGEDIHAMQQSVGLEHYGIAPDDCVSRRHGYPNVGLRCPNVF